MIEQNTNLAALSAAGVAVWLDDLSRERLRSGNLAELIATKSVVGVTTNPTIFASAVANGDAYDQQLRELAGQGTDVEDIVRAFSSLPGAVVPRDRPPGPIRTPGPRRRTTHPTTRACEHVMAVTDPAHADGLQPNLTNASAGTNTWPNQCDTRIPAGG